MQRLKLVVLMSSLVVVAGCSSGSSGLAGPAVSTPAAASEATPTPTEVSASPSGSPTLPPLALSALPPLSGGYSYLEAPAVGDPVQPPKRPTQAPVRGFTTVGVSKGSTPPAVASLELIRFDPSLASSPVLDEVATEQAQALGKGESKTIDGVTVRRVANIQGMGVNGVVFRRGTDVVLIFSPEAAEASAIAAAYLAGS
jgi:hypothetical protein